jgi:DNA-binding MarR family transcriptional regulator
MPTDVDAPAIASDLRLVIGSLTRRLRVESEIPLTHMAVLGRLYRDGAASASELAAAECVRPQSMATIVAELAHEEMITRERDPRDGRRIQLELTGAGRKAVEDSRRQRDSWLSEAIGEQLSGAERRALEAAIPLLQRLAER